MQRWNERKKNQINEVLRILKGLKKDNISFVILRNYEFLGFPSREACPRDLDILIPLHDLDTCIKFFRKNDYICQHTLNHYGFSNFLKKDVSFDIQVGNICERNIPYLSFSDISSSIIDIDGIPVLAGNRLLIHLVIHCIINKGTFKHEYREKITSLLTIKQNREELLEFLIKFFLKSTANYILNNLIDKKIEKLSDKRGFFVLLHSLRHIKSLFPFSKFVGYKFSNNFPLKGKIIAIIGLDGTGKTTLANALIEKLRERNIKSHYLYMGRKRGHALPMHAISKKMGITQLKKRKKQPNLLYKVCRDGMYVLDMLFRYVFYIFPKKYSNHLVVCDRYAYSIYLDRNQTFISKYALKYLYPRPNMLIFIDTPEHEIIHRKNEYGEEERKYLLERWMVVVELFNAEVIISQDVNKMVYRLLWKLFEIYSK